MSSALADFLGRELSELTADPSAVGAPELELLWRRLYPGDDRASRAGFSAFEQSLGAQLESEEDDEHRLDLRAGGWTIDITNSVVRSALVLALLSGALVAAGAAGLAPLVLPAVLPLLVDIDKVRLRPSDELLIAELRLNTDAYEGGLSPDELYRRLPARTRRAVSPLDFADFLDLIRRAGVAQDRGDGNLVILDPAEARFRVSIT